MENFNQIFTSPKALEMGLKLKEIVESYVDNIQGNISGGAKVKLVLYSRNGKNNVLCGIQEGADESCLFYVHHVNQIDHERLKFSGKGKHAKRIRFFDIKDIMEDDIKWLLSKVNENAPF